MTFFALMHQSQATTEIHANLTMPVEDQHGEIQRYAIAETRINTELRW
jgi:dTDP-D-glucose 4,6-dehydratase